MTGQLRHERLEEFPELLEWHLAEIDNLPRIRWPMRSDSLLSKLSEVKVSFLEKVYECAVTSF